MRWCAAWLLLMFAAGTATADCGEDGDICPGDSPWARSDSASVRLQEEGSADFTLWEFAFGGGEDLLLNVQSKQGHELTRGSILLVSGRAMLTKDLALEKGFEIDALDVPVLMYQLVVSLLAQAVPEGPEELVASRVVDVAEVERAIRIGTQSASGGFSPPWSVEGEVESTGSSQFEYSLTFTYSIGPGETAGMHLSGSWSRRPEGSSLEDSLDIQGWSLHTIGPFSVEQEGVTIFDFGAQASSLEVRTLGELRKALAVDDASANR